MVLGEMDVAWVKPNRSSQGDPPVHKATGSHLTSQLRPPTPGWRLGVRLMPGGRRPPGPEYKERRGMGMNLGEDKRRDRLSAVTSLIAP